MNTLEKLLEKIGDGSAVIGVVGLGYVGLPLFLAYTGKKFRVLGLDIDQSKIDAIEAGESYIEHISSEPIAEAVKSGLLEVTTDFSRAAEADALILCVPTPLDEHYEPDLSYVTSTVESLVPHIRAGQVMSLESTTYPGTTEEELRPRIESRG
ncbi:MAG: NAD(P)-binding domain-containing protein, partial [Roseibacillus sp.]